MSLAESPFTKPTQLLDQEYQVNTSKALKSRLKLIIAEQALKIAGKGTKFTLSSGQEADYYYDLKQILMDPVANSCIGRLILQEVSEQHIDSFGGLESGAIPISTAVTLESLKLGQPVRGFSVLKAKNLANGWLEGNMLPGDKAIIVEDVITTAESSILAYQRAKEWGLNPKGIVCILDRESGGREKLEQMGIPLMSLFVHSEFKDLLPV